MIGFSISEIPHKAENVGKLRFQAACEIGLNIGHLCLMGGCHFDFMSGVRIKQSVFLAAAHFVPRNSEEPSKLMDTINSAHVGQSTSSHGNPKKLQFRPALIGVDADADVAVFRLQEAPKARGR
jgi:hypothetical protein